MSEPREFWLDMKWVELNSAPVARTSQATRFYPSSEYEALRAELDKREEIEAALEGK